MEPTRPAGWTSDSGDEALRASEERFRLATKAGRVGVWDWDIRANSVTWSDVVYQIHGVPPGEFGGTVEAFTRLVHAEDLELVSAAIQRALEANEPYEVEFRVVRPVDGEVAWIYTQAEVVRDAAGAPQRMLGATVDVTRQKETDTALHRHLRELRTIYGLSAALSRAAEVDEIVDAALDGLVGAVSADRASVLLFDDAGIMRFKGWRGLSETYRRAVDGHSPWKPGDVDARPIVVRDVAADDGLGPLKETILGEGIRALGFIPLVSGGRVLGKFMVYYDRPHEFGDEEIQVCQTIAGHVGYAIERARSEAALRETSRRKDDFLATLGHELRNPLAPLRNMLHVMEGEELNETLRRAREMMERQVEQLSRLVDDLLDVSRINQGQIRLRPERLDLRGVARETVESFRPVCERRDQSLELSVPAAAVLLDADSTRLTQVLENLLTNASKFTPVGGRIAVALEAGSNEAVLRVTDTGLGIRSEHLPHVFERFSNHGSSHDGSGHVGLGIGLSLVRDLVELHGGSVEARSDGPGMGSEFTVRLPSLPTGSALPIDRKDSVAGLGSAPARRILVVDDNEDAAASLAILLELHGHTVHTRFDGDSAIEAFREHQPDVVLLDLGLPTLSGYEAARRIRADGGDQPLLVALTGWGQDEDRRRTREAGFDAHLVKPLDVDELTRLLED